VSTARRLSLRTRPSCHDETAREPSASSSLILATLHVHAARSKEQPAGLTGPAGRRPSAVLRTGVYQCAGLVSDRQAILQPDDHHNDISERKGRPILHSPVCSRSQLTGAWTHVDTHTPPDGIARVLPESATGIPLMLVDCCRQEPGVCVGLPQVADARATRPEDVRDAPFL
jgi:hypothetical protein